MISFIQKNTSILISGSHLIITWLANLSILIFHGLAISGKTFLYLNIVSFFALLIGLRLDIKFFSISFRDQNSYLIESLLQITFLFVFLLIFSQVIEIASNIKISNYIFGGYVASLNALLLSYFFLNKHFIFFSISNFSLSVAILVLISLLPLDLSYIISVALTVQLVFSLVFFSLIADITKLQSEAKFITFIKLPKFDDISNSFASILFFSIPLACVLFIDFKFGAEHVGVWGNILRIYCLPLVIYFAIANPFINKFFGSLFDDKKRKFEIPKTLSILVSLTIPLIAVLILSQSSYLLSLLGEIVINSETVLYIFFIHIIFIVIKSMLPLFHILNYSKVILLLGAIYLIFDLIFLSNTAIFDEFIFTFFIFSLMLFVFMLFIFLKTLFSKNKISTKSP